MHSIDQEYNDALDYLYSFVDFSKTRNLRYSPEEFDLSRMHKLIELMGNPQYDYPVIHVAGTKGKGSTCAIITSILTHSGNKVGFYSSPHMIDFRERFRINDAWISKEAFTQCIDQHKPIISKVENVSTFEISTALAFKYFSDEEVDFGVIEVGMGGRLDATNVVKPTISVITPISLDHTKILGNTIEKIAKEKAGIIKEEIPVVISQQPSSAKSVIREIAEGLKAPIIDAAELYSYEIKNKSFLGQNVEMKRLDDGKTHDLKIPLLGEHQIDNTRTSIATIKVLKEKGYHILNDAIEKGIENVKWPGRFETISEKPLVVIDCAHNPDSAKKLKQTIKDYLPGIKVSVIFGVSEDKDHKSMLAILQPIVKSWIFTRSSHPRALGLTELRKTTKQSGLENCKFMEIEQTLEILGKEESQSEIYIATGSIFVAAALKDLLGKRARQN